MSCSLERLELLSALKVAGLPLGARQKVANGLAAAKREGRLVAPSLRNLTPRQLDLSDDAQAPAAAEHKAAPSPGIASTHVPVGQHIRVFVISDAHSDYAVNLQWLKAKLPDRAPGAFDVCLCAGDVSDNLDVLKEALAVLTARFNETFFVAGNHDLWVRPPPINDGRPSFTTSLDRLTEVQQLCEKMGVRTTPLWLVSPATARDVLVVPLSSWYHSSFDTEPELPVAYESDSLATFSLTWSDFRMCKWPQPLSNNDGSDTIARHFARLNEPHLNALLPALPLVPATGRPPPARKLDKSETYALYGAAPHTTGPTWTSVDPDTFFTRRKAPAAAPTVAESAGGAGAATARPFVISLSHMVPRQAWSSAVPREGATSSARRAHVAAMELKAKGNPDLSARRVFTDEVSAQRG